LCFTRKSRISSVGVEDGIRNSPLSDKLSESAGLKYNLKRNNIVKMFYKSKFIDIIAITKMIW